MSATVEVDVRRSGRRFEATAVIDVAAPREVVWQTITDYPALPTFMPGIRACRVLDRTEAGGVEQLKVHQRGEFKFLLFAQTMDVDLEIEQRPMTLARAHALRFEVGLLKARALEVFDGTYRIEASPADAGRSRSGARLQTRLYYDALIVLRVPPPPAIGTVAVRQNLAAQLEAVAQEVLRRATRRTA